MDEAVVKQRRACGKTKPRVTVPPAERFWTKVNKSGPVHPALGTRCWVWTAATNESGYGLLRIGGRTGHNERAHRLAYRLLREEPGDKMVCHKCDNPPCVNPDHLFLGDHRANAEDMVTKDRGGGAKLTVGDIADIRASVEHVNTLAIRYGMGPEAIANARRGDTWKHAPGKPLVKKRGSDHYAAILTEDAVRDIRSSTSHPRELAKKYGVHYTNIHNVLRRLTWKHVT